MHSQPISVVASAFTNPVLSPTIYPIIVHNLGAWISCWSVFESQIIFARVTLLKVNVIWMHCHHPLKEYLKYVKGELEDLHCQLWELHLSTRKEEVNIYFGWSNSWIFFFDMPGFIYQNTDLFFFSVLAYNLQKDISLIWK